MQGDIYNNLVLTRNNIYQNAEAIINNNFSEPVIRGELLAENITINIINTVEDMQTSLWEAVENINADQLEFLITEIKDCFSNEDQALIYNDKNEGQNVVGRLLTKRIGCLEIIETLKAELEQKENFTIFLDRKKMDEKATLRMGKKAEIEAQELKLSKIKIFILKISSVSYFNQEEDTGFIENDKSLTTKDALFLYDFESLKDRFWRAVTDLSFEQIEALITEIENSDLSHENKKLIFNSRRQDENAIGFLVARHKDFGAEKERLKAQLDKLEETGIFKTRQNINNRNAKMAEIEHQDEMLLKIKECIFKIFNMPLFNQDEAIGFVLDARPSTAIEALSVIYHLELLQEVFWRSVETLSDSGFALLIKSIKKKNLSQDEQSLIFNSKKEGKNAVDYLFNVYRNKCLSPRDMSPEEVRIENIINNLKNIRDKINKQDEIDNLIDELNDTNFKYNDRVDTSELISKFWLALESLDVANLATLIREILIRKIHYEDQILIFNSRKGVLNAVGMLAKKLKEIAEFGPQYEMVGKIVDFIFKISKILVFKKEDGVGVGLKSDDVYDTNVSSVVVLAYLGIVNGDALILRNTIKDSLKIPLNLEKLELLIEEIRNNELTLTAELLRIVFFDSDLDGILSELECFSFNEAKRIKSLIYNIQNIACFKKNSEFPADLDILDFYRLLSLDQKLNTLWDILHTEDKTGLYTVIEEIKTLDYEEKNKVLNARFLNANHVSVDLVDIENCFSSYVGINILGKLFIDFMSVSIQQKPIKNKIFYYIKLVVDIPEFNINEYVIRGSWQDVRLIDTANEIAYNKYSGMNILHLAILENHQELYLCILHRNRQLKADNIVDQALYVNFEYPMAHPKHYMSSPAKLYQRLGRSWGVRSVQDNPENWSDSSLHPHKALQER